MQVTRSAPSIREVIGVRLPRQTWLSPDGQWLAHSEVFADWEHNVFRQRVIVTDLLQMREAFAVDEDAFASGIKWAWDSKSIGYIAIRQGQNVLRKVDCADGSTVDVACSANRFTDFDWHPSSSKVVIAEDAPPQEEFENELFSVQGQLSQSANLILVDQSGEALRFEGLDRVYHISNLSCSPTGDKVLFTAIPEPDNRVQCRHLLVLDLTTGELVRLIAGKRAIFFPIWKEDGSQVAFSERKRAWDDLRGAAIKTMRISDLSERVLLANVEHRCLIQRWNGDRMLVSGQLKNKALDVYAVSVDSGECAKATVGDMPLRTGVSVSKPVSSIAYIAQEADRFHEVTVESEAAPAPVRITNYHSQVQSWPKLIQQTVIWKTPDGHNVEGMLIDARSNAETDQHPLIVLIHGGPSSSTNAHDHLFHWYFEFLTANPIRQWSELGISVFMPDYHGSSGYGLGFRKAIAGKLGELESGDILSGVDHLLAEYDFDPSKVGVAGMSYGGYLTMLLAAKYPSRFAAASAFCGFSDLRLMLYASAGNLEAYANEDDWNPGTPSGSLSPLSYIDSDCPPMLLQTGDVDKTVPPAHSHAFYRSLKKHGGTVKLITYKNCGHTIDHPRQLLAAQEHNLEWFAKWL